MLLYIVNKINLLSDERRFQVKMKLSVTYDSGFLAVALNYFKNKHFAEILSDKGFDNVFSHFNLKAYRIKQDQEGQK